LGPDGRVLLSDSFPPDVLVDTLGAGDTFNSAVIYTLSNGETGDSETGDGETGEGRQVTGRQETGRQVTGRQVRGDR